MSCGVDCRHGSDPELLWLWHRLVAATPIWPLVWEPSYAAGGGCSPKKQKKAKNPPLILCYCQFPFLWLLVVALYIVLLLHWGHIYFKLLFLLHVLILWSLCNILTVSCDPVYFKIYFVWYEYCYSCFYFFLSLFIFPLYSMGTKLHIHGYIIFPPIVLLPCNYLDIVLSATQQDLMANPFQKQ